MPRPSFRSYLRVMRHEPGFGFGLFAVLCFTARNAMAEGPVGAAVSVLVGCGIGVAMFPWWRRQASRDPITYTYGQPELLTDECEGLSVHPSEPTSNVHLRGPAKG